MKRTIRFRRDLYSVFNRNKASAANEKIPRPTFEQLRIHYISNGLPMVGFGFMDETVMIQAGNAIDCSIGVTFGLSTLSAAAIGGLISNVSGIIFGGSLESLAKAAGLPNSNLTAAQRSLPFVKRNRLLSQAVGVLLGCTMGLVNLFFIDHERSSSLKLQQKTEENEFAFEVEVSNDDPDFTSFVVRGPDNDGLLAAITSAFAVRGCAILNVSASRLPNGMVEDTFSVIDQKTRKRLDDDELGDVSRIILESTTKGCGLYRLNEVESENYALKERVKHLESIILQRRVTLRPSSREKG